MAEGKWIPDLKPSMPVAEAARRVLSVRLQVVQDYLPRALKEAEQDLENVHQLRVGTRRARAALDIFALCLPKKVYRSARKQLRRVRRAAGEARDWDVFLITLDEHLRQAADPERPGLDFLFGYAHGQRVAAQAQIEEMNAEHGAAVHRTLAETAEAVRPPHDDHAPATLKGLARPLLLDRIAKLEQAAAKNLDDYENLHQVRIAGKRLRYAMEVFADCFGPAFREELYPAVEEMQEFLGRANDSHVAAQRLKFIRDRIRTRGATPPARRKGLTRPARLPDQWKRLQPGVEGLLKWYRRQLPAERRRFTQWWKRWQGTDGESTLAAFLQEG